MDPITIYLQRLKGRPVRVFTGFLDETPYYELYPGVIEFSASCTLKKLLYTYFDPALPYTRSFLAEYGWITNGDGTIKNPLAEMGVETEKDGGMGSLLFATMKEIGHWKDNNIKIEALPKGLIKRMANMLRTFEEDHTEARRELETLIERFIGSGDYGSSGSMSGVDVSGYDGDVAEIIYQVGKAMQVPIKYMLAAFMTGIVESGMRNLNYGDADSKGWRQERTSIYGTGANGPTNVNASAKRFFQECKQHDKGDSQTAGQLAADVQRPAAQYRGRYDEVRAKAVSLMEKTKARVDRKNLDENDPGRKEPDRTVRAGKKSSDAQMQLEQPIDVHGAGPGMQVIYQLARSYKLTLTAGRDDHDKYTSSGNISDHSRGWALDLSNGTSPTPEMDAFNKFVKENLKGMIKQLIWRDHDQFTGASIGGHMNHVHIALVESYAMNKQKTLDAVVEALNGRPLNAPDDSATANDVDTGGSDAMMSRVNATILAATMNWASWEETTMSTALQGNKSLLNDKPLMPFIQQMSESSLRQFMSMPNGDFFAFYPDYFGETWHRPPYWMIDDIEVLEGRVKLNDAALVTHEYAIGNTTLSGDILQNSLLSTGSISIVNAFQSGWVTTEADQKKDSKDEDTEKLFHAFNRILKQDEAIQFLERYGARPDVQDFPFILNPFYELFMAYQRFMQAWSRQFLSPFKLTFMPELYPGGKVGFPEHGLQMYVEEVTHSWDYSSGFVTEAELSAPAAMLDNKGRPINGNLPINMPTALLEVAAKKTDPGGNGEDRGGSTGVVLAPGPNGELRPT